MKNKELAKKIKELRNRKVSQEELSEKARLSLRTIQRVENGDWSQEAILKRIGAAFGVAPDEILDWAVYEDKGLLTSLNLSALSFILFPLLGILIPLIIWISKKDKVKDINKIAKDILNFQITWTIVLFIGFIIISSSAGYRINSTGNIDAGIITTMLITNLVFISFMHLYNIVLIIVNSARINKEKVVKYFPKIACYCSRDLLEISSTTGNRTRI